MRSSWYERGRRRRGWTGRGVVHLPVVGIARAPDVYPCRADVRVAGGQPITTVRSPHKPVCHRPQRQTHPVAISHPTLRDRTASCVIYGVVLV